MDETDGLRESGTGVTDGTAVRQVSVFLQNRVGTLLSVVELLRANHIVVLGLSVQDSIDFTVVRLIASDPDLVETLFIEKGIPFSTSDLIVVELIEGPEQMPDCLRTLLDAETNIHFIYPLLTRPNGKSALALCMEDNDFGKSILSSAGYQILLQEDLSR